MLEVVTAADISGVGDGAVIFFFSVMGVEGVADTAELLADETAGEVVVVVVVAAEEASINPAEIRVQTENEYRKRV